MKKSLLLIATFCFFMVGLSAQTIPGAQFPNVKMAIQSLKPINHHQRVKDSQPLSLYNQQFQGNPSSILKSTPAKKQKMDSLHILRYNNDLKLLTTLNRDRFAFDSEGRVILAISYTRNTWDDQYHWYKDSLKYDADGNTTLQISYTRELETDPWTLEYQTDAFYDNKGRDTLAIYTSKDWDTGVLVSGKTVTVYDDVNRTVQAVAWRQNAETGIWEKTGKMEFTLTESGELLQYSFFTWIPETSTWVHLILQQYTYNDQGLITSFAYYEWEVITETWGGLAKDVYTYDNEGNMTESLFSAWDTLTKQWVNRSKITREFGPNGVETEVVNYSWIMATNEWQPDSRVSQVFDANGNKNQFVVYSWDSTGSRWEPLNKETQTFNEKDNPIEYQEFEWSDGHNDWIPVVKLVNTYNSNEKITLADSFIWDSTASSWLENAREENDFDSYGNMLQSLSLGEKDSTGQWTSKSRFEYTYNHTWLDVETITPYGWSGVAPYHQLLGSIGYRWDHTTGDWYIGMQSDYYYSAFNGGSGIIETPGISTRVYPNPASDILYIETTGNDQPARFEMLDLQGRKVLSETLTGNHNKLMVNDLPAGIYLYQIIMKGETVNGKMVKR